MAKKPTSSRANFTESISTIIGISLVLTMLGLLGIVIAIVQHKSAEYKDQVKVSIFMKEDVTEPEVLKFKKTLEAKDYSKSSKYISKDEAADIMIKEIGEDFVAFLGENPLPYSIDLVVHPSYTRLDSVEWIINDINQFSVVKEVVYQANMIQSLNSNFNKIGLGLLIFSGILLIIAFALINNTIRLAIFSKRFIIKSMQLVGATHGFIRKPFILKGISYGIISGIIALAFLIGIVYALRNHMPQIAEIIFDQYNYLIIGASILILGIALSWLFTRFAVNKFIRLEQNQLY